MNQLDRVTLASRVFCIAAVLGLTLLSRDGEVLFSLVVVATVAMTAVYVSLVTELRGIWVVAVEALVSGLVIGSAPPGGVVLLPYLVVLSLIAGITRGLVGLAIVMLADLPQPGAPARVRPVVRVRATAAHPAAHRGPPALRRPRPGQPRLADAGHRARDDR